MSTRERELEEQVAVLRARLAEAEATIAAIRRGAVDGIVVKGPDGPRVFTLTGANRPYRLLVESMFDGALLLDAEGSILYANRRFTEMAGLQPTAVAGLPLEPLLAPSARVVWRVLLERGYGQRDLRLRTGDGGERPVRVALSAFELDGARVHCLVVTDTTEAERAAAELARARTVQAILRQAQDPMLVCDAATVVTHANPAAEQLRGDPIVGRPIGEVLVGEDAPLLLALVRRALRNQRHHGQQLRLTGREGPRDFLLSCGPLEQGGRTLGAVLSLTDITERRRAEETLRRSEQRFRALAEALPAFVWEAERDGSVRYLNATWEHFTGKPPAEGLGRGWLDAVHPDDVPLLREEWNRATSLEQPYAVEVRFRDRDGAYRAHAIRGLPVREEGAGVSRWIGAATDIEELKRYEQDLQEADRRKDEFLATLSHELRNPLAPIRNAVGILHAAGITDPALRRARDIIDRQVDQLARLVDDLLDVSRISRGQVTLRRELLPLAEILDAAIEIARPLVASAGHELALELDHAGLAVDVDRTRIVQVISNLVGNAVKFTPPGGRITIASGRRDGDVFVRVEDTGIGIPAEAQTRIFDLFAQEDADLARRYGGLGIGLTLVDRLVHLHGGTVEVASEGPGRGAAFTVLLPAVALPAESPRRAQRRRRAASGKRVLVVEDNADAADSFRMLLEMRGHVVRVACDGEQALAIDDFEPDVAFVDLGLPKIDGFEVARRLRGRCGSALLLVALSGYGREEDKARAREAGCDHHLTKPIQLAAIDRLLGTRRRPRFARSATPQPSARGGPPA